MLSPRCAKGVLLFVLIQLKFQAKSQMCRGSVENNMRLKKAGFPDGLSIEESYMKRAIVLARRGEGFVNPNPMVGAVIVKSGAIIGEGYHKGVGLAHAERDALAGFREVPEGAEMFVTLEPCCHYGKTPPCTEAIIESGIKKVYVGCLDPNPKVSGKGVEVLRKHGIEVKTGVLQEECEALNKVFFHYIQNNMPYVILKYAMTMDGKIATTSGKSKWITGELARGRVHLDRHRYMGIMVGVGTVLADDPRLDCRLSDSTIGRMIDIGENIETDEKVRKTNCGSDEDLRDESLFGNEYREPIRIICDTHLRTPLSAQVVETAREQRTWIATCEKDVEKWKPYQEKGCEIILLPLKKMSVTKSELNLEQLSLECNEHEEFFEQIKGEGVSVVDIKALLVELSKREIDSVILEGGSALNGSFLDAGLVNRVQCYIAPKLFGGLNAKSPIGGVGVAFPKDGIRLSHPTVEVLGDDLLLESEVLSCLQE